MVEDEGGLGQSRGPTIGHDGMYLGTLSLQKSSNCLNRTKMVIQQLQICSARTSGRYMYLRGVSIRRILCMYAACSCQPPPSGSRCRTRGMYSACTGRSVNDIGHWGPELCACPDYSPDHERPFNAKLPGAWIVPYQTATTPNATYGCHSLACLCYAHHSRHLFFCLFVSRCRSFLGPSR